MVGPARAAVALRLWLPELPYHLARAGKTAEALAVLNGLARTNGRKAIIAGLRAEPFQRGSPRPAQRWGMPCRPWRAVADVGTKARTAGPTSAEVHARGGRPSRPGVSGPSAGPSNSAACPTGAKPLNLEHRLSHGLR